MPEEPERPLTDVLVRLFGLDKEGLTAGFIGTIIEPLLQTLVIVGIAAAVIWVVRYFGGRFVRHVIASRVLDTPRAEQRIMTFASVLSNVVSIAVWGTAVLVILAQVFGVDVWPIIAGAGIVGIAIAFGAQDLVKDWISGMFMMLEDAYGVGDVIDVGDATGTVEEMGIRSTSVRDDNGTLWHMPNGEIRRVGNKSQGWSRAIVDVPVAYDEDIDRALGILRDVSGQLVADATWAPMMLSEPDVRGVESVRAEEVVLRVAVRTQAGHQWEVERELRARIKRSFDAAHIAPPTFVGEALAQGGLKP